MQTKYKNLTVCKREPHSTQCNGTLTSSSAGGGPTGMWAHVPFRVVPDRALQTMDQPPVAYPQAPSLGLA